MLAAIAKYESRFAVHFAQFLWLSKFALSSYVNADYAAHANRVTVVHDANSRVGEYMARLTRLANLPDLTTEERKTYRYTLERLFRMFPVSPNHYNSVVIAPRREGALLARRLGWLGSSKHIEPNLKRIPFDGGLLVGCDARLEQARGATLDIVDGALATGATAMAILAICRPLQARLFCGHATAQGVAALLRFASEISVDAKCIVGDVSGILNSHFYAVLPEDPARVCVGDLGDTIAPLEIAEQVHTE